MLLCETWLGPHSLSIKIARYNFVHTDRVGKKGGGVGILIANCIKFKERKDITLDSQECESGFINTNKEQTPDHR